MPRGLNISAATRKEWLVAHEDGKSIDSIAKESGRTARTVNDQVERARRERDQREILGGLLREAWVKHFDDLFAFLEETREASRTPNSRGLFPKASLRTDMLKEALQTHIPKSRLWKASADWKTATREMEKVTRNIKSAINNRTELVHRDFPEFKADGVSEILWVLISGIASGRDTPGRITKMEETNTGLRLSSGATTLADRISDSARAEKLDEKYCWLRDELAAEDSAHVKNLREAQEKESRVRWIIEEEVEEILLRHLLPGLCKLCPGR